MARRGEKHHKAKLTNYIVHRMRDLHYLSGISIKQLALRYNIGYATAWDAVNYNTWKHVKD